MNKFFKCRNLVAVFLIDFCLVILVIKFQTLVFFAFTDFQKILVFFGFYWFQIIYPEKLLTYPKILYHSPMKKIFVASRFLDSKEQIRIYISFDWFIWSREITFEKSPMENFIAWHIYFFLQLFPIKFKIQVSMKIPRSLNQLNIVLFCDSFGLSYCSHLHSE
jgi:hypothetical protein